MKRKNPERVYEPVDSAYSQVVSTRREKTVHVAGTVSKDTQGRLIGAGDMEAQVHRVMENVRRSLSCEGATLSDVARVRTFTTDMDRYLSADEIVLDSFEESEKPASTLVSVNRLADCFEGVDGATDATGEDEKPRYLVEVDATAFVE
jgi:enamine deaminase RidA (YjgF/YER057c/UK114 family)